ncbi:hypothetical protein A3F05_03795 [Candidatus Saccharibacteria bacterium RIFCSPHIGHO2_12_FULL_47_17]|nr:MAG: hypothetical protein A3F05_03795 [Candidatus Saccharibacteria bacterium RIFCSPHIGHO2_12_FULL_47_17]
MQAKKHRRAHGRRDRSIDGIITSNPHLGTPAAPSGGANDFSGELGSLASRAEGFHPMRAGSHPVGTLAQEINPDPLEEPIVLDDIKPQKAKRQSKHPRRRRFIKRLALSLLVIILAAGLFLGFKAYKTQQQLLAGGGAAPAVCNGNVDINKLKIEGDGRVNILLLGIGGEEHQGGDLSDTIIIASLDPLNNKIDLLSIPRDLWVKIPNNGYQKLNAAFAYGKQNSKAKDATGEVRDGVNLADQTIESVLGVPIHYHAVVNFSAFEDIVNALGGVDMYVTPEMAAYERLWIEGTNQHYTLDVKAGQQHFDGRRALYFARQRTGTSDFVRGQRQRALLVAIKDKIFSVGTFSNPIKVSSLLDSLGKNVYTDFDSGSIKCLYQQTKEVSSANIRSLDLVTPPNDLLTTGSAGGLSIVRPKLGLYDFSQVQNYVRNTLRDSYLAKENSSIAVYNGTTIAGVGKTKGDELKSYGYNVTLVDNAPKQTNPLNTILVDLSGAADKYTRHYLEQRFKLFARDSIPAEFGITAPQGTKFVIIAGKDVQQ